MADARCGLIVVLNGTSSSGKTTLARQLQIHLPGSWIAIAMDTFSAAVWLEAEPDLGTILRLNRAVHRSIAAISDEGWNVIFDVVLEMPEWADDLAVALADRCVTFVGVRCDPDVATAREIARGDRQPGMAAAQSQMVHEHCVYDVEVDTTSATPKACAGEINAALLEAPVSRIFERVASP